MPLSPVCLVSDNSGPFVPTTNGVNVGPGDNIQIMLQSPSGVGTWYLIIYGTDELTTSPPALTNVNPATGQVISPTSIVSFTYPGTPAGRSIVFQSTVVSGSNTAQTTFAIYSLTPNGDRVGAVGETREGNVNYGWAALLNPILRLGAAYLYYNDGITNPPTGASTIQGAIDYLKTHAGGGGGPDIGAIHPQSFSSAGPGGSTYSPIGYETGSIVGVGGGSFETAIYDANTTINGGPFIWGVSGGSIFRYNTDASQGGSNNSFVLVPLSDFFVIASPSDLTQDSSFNIWAIEGASQTLVKIQEDPPKILASYPIPGTPKYLIAYDAVTNELILSNYVTTIAKCSTAGVFSSDITPPGLVGNETITAIYVFGGFLFILGTNTGGLSGYVHKYTLPSVTLVGTATISPMNTPTSVYPTAATYIQNGSSPKLFVSVSVSPGPVAGTPIYRIDVTTMTVDTYVSISSASSELLSLAIDPVASPPSLWVADDDTRPSVVYVIADILVTFTYSTTYPVDPATNSVSLSIFWDTYGGTYFWVVCTGSVSSISQLLPSGTVRSTTQFADTTYIVRPGNSGYVLTSQGPGLVPTWTAPSSGGAASTFVYRPGGTPESNVFTTFEAAVTAANALFGAATTIYVDATFGTPQVVGTGLDLTNITLIGYIQNGSSGPATLTFQTGSSIVNVWAALVNITVVGANVMSVSPETQLYLQGSYATIQGTGGNAFFNAPAPFGQPISIELAGTAFVVGDGENPVFNLVFAYSGIYLIEIGADVQPQNNFVSGSFENVYIFVSASAGIEELEVGVQYLGFVVYPPTLIGYIVGYAPDNTPITVDATHCDAQVDPSAGPVTVNISGYAYTGMPVRVTDITGFAATNNITVTAESIENPYSIGSFSSSVTLNTNSAAVVWYLDLAGNFKVLSASLPASGGFTDNASAARTHNEPGLRRNEFNTGGGEGGENVIDLEGTYGINWPLIDGPGVAGNGIAILSDKFFFVGHDSEGARGALYGIDLFNYLPVSIGYLRNYGDAPADLIGIRGMANDLETADWLFGIFPDTTPAFIELGTISGLPQNMTYTTYYNTSLAEGVVPVRACFGQFGGGGFDGINVPIFFYSGSDGNIYLTTTTGAINTWFSTGDQPGALFVDDLGNLWVLYMESNTLVRLTPPEVGPATISLSIPMPPGTNYVIDMVSDGRFARVLAIYGDRVTIFAFDLQSGAQGPTLALDYIDSLGDYPHIAWDGVSLYVSTGTYAADTPQLYRINAMTNEVLFATAFGANNGRTSTRGIVVQDSGTVILATYDSEANLNFGLAAGNFPNVNFNSIGILGRPLTFLNGGQLQNIIEVNAFSPGTFDAYHSFAACDTSTGACSVTMFVPLDFPNQYTFAGRWMVGVWDFSGNALTNNITVYASEGIPIEDPSAPGTYLDTVVLAQNGVSAVWVLDYVMSVWKLYSYAGPLPLAGTEGALLYYTGGAWTPLPAGSSGEVLAMGVSDPEWVSPSAIGAGWQTVLDLDFTAQSSQSLGTDGDHTIAGLTFVKANSANDASPMVLTSGTGIVITPVSNTNYFASTDSMPELRLSLVQIIPDIQFGTPIRLWLYISSANYTAEYDDVVLALEGPGNINASYTFKRGWNTNNANGYLTAYNYDGSSVGQTSDQNTNATDNVIIVTAEAGYPNPQFSSQSGAYSSGWPSPSIVNAHVGINASGFGITPAGTPQNVGLVFGAHRAGSSTNFVATIARLRVDYRI